MSKTNVLFVVLAALTLAWAPMPARADFSACGSAYAAKDPHQQIDLYTNCLKHGGLMRTDVAGAFTNRGYVYYQLAEMEKALKLAPREKQYLDARDRLAESCPIVSKPPS